VSEGVGSTDNIVVEIVSGSTNAEIRINGSN
jgi:hypothetical protein